MKRKAAVDELIGEIDKTLAILRKIDDYHESFVRGDLLKLGRGVTSAIVLAEIFSVFYTACETLFLRISRFFENSLSPGRWHSDLLRKMNISIENSRPRVLSDGLYALMGEFMKFRHFKRYYVRLEYDWDKLDFLDKKYAESIILLRSELGTFRAFLESLSINEGR